MSASALAGRIAECRGLLAATGRPSIVLALLGRSDWESVSDRPYGMPHHSAADSPYIIVIHRTGETLPRCLWGFNAPRRRAGRHGVDRYVHLAALHEVGHLLTDAALETTTEAIRTRFPFWYGEFLANYFADACLAPQAERERLPPPRRGGTGGDSSSADHHPRRRGPPADRKRNPGPPLVTTEAGGLNFAHTRVYK